MRNNTYVSKKKHQGDFTCQKASGKQGLFLQVESSINIQEGYLAFQVHRLKQTNKKTLQFTQRLRYSDAAVAKGREVQTPNLHVVFVLRQKVCILSKDLQRDCLNQSCILQYMSQFHPLPGFTCMLNEKGNFVQTGYPLLFPVISMCRRCTSAETWITSSYRSGEGFIITSKVFCPKI